MRPIISLRKLAGLFNRQTTQKTYEQWAGRKYTSDPQITFVIQCHNKSESVCKLVSKLRHAEHSEIIVIDDGSLLNHTKLLSSYLNRPNEFLLRANDLYEVIMYDRAIWMARGEYIVLMQDDDDFSDLNWVAEGLRYLKADPKLTILGGRDGGKLLPFETTIDGARGPYEFDGKTGGRVNSFRFELSGIPASKHSFEYVMYTDRAPMWLNRKIFIKTLSHIDISFAPFQWDDAEVCLRTWRSGYHVAWYKANFQLEKLGVGGMRLWNTVLQQRQDEVNAKKLYQLHGAYLSQICLWVEAANKQILAS